MMNLPIFGWFAAILGGICFAAMGSAAEAENDSLVFFYAFCSIVLIVGSLIFLSLK